MRGLAVFTLILLLIAGVAYAAEQANTEQMKKAEVVGNKVCPVSGEKIDGKMKQTYEYKGKIYNFCCPMCVEKFKKDPEKYLEKIEKSEESKQEEHSTHGGHHHSH